MSPTAVQKAAGSAFRLISQWRCNGLVNVARYRSENTGLKVTIADTPGPVVSGYICLATETDTDDGLPHTLEHLVFMGSKQYPYKGLLDLVANRCLASGTNAWTDTDHTAYTLTTAGSRGFLIMLPIYLDHIFHPLLTEAQYVTEVHHVNGQGEDAGVVYCEMQEREADMDEMVSRNFMQRVYPGSGYASITGGRLVNLRTSTNHNKVKDFHQSYYNPQNCEVIISGDIDHSSVFDALEDVEKTLVSSQLSQKAIRRPWTAPVPALHIEQENGIACREVVVTCPSDDEQYGTVIVGWRGPKVEQYPTIVALEILQGYLSESAASPLERDFVQLADPFCSKVCTTMDDYSESCLQFHFEGVKTDRLKSIKPRLMETLRKIMSQEESLDMDRMRDLLRQYELRTASLMETDAHSTVAQEVIKIFIYSNTDDEAAKRLDVISIYRNLRSETKDYWLSLMKKYLQEELPHICIIGEPSSAEVKKLTEGERKRLKEQKQRLGKQGLSDCAEALEKAMKENEKNTPPLEVMNRCIVDSLDGINYFSILPSTNRSPNEDKNPRCSLSEIPFTTLLDDCSGTNFVRFSVQLDTSALDDELRPLLLLWSNLIFESPIISDGVVMPYNEVVKQLERDLVSYDVCSGIANNFFRMISVDVNVDVERANRALQWIRNVLYEIIFDPERIRVIAQRLINSAAEIKRDGDAVAKFLIKHLCHQPKSQPLVFDLMRQEVHLSSLLKCLEERSDEIMTKLKRVQSIITNPDGIIVHLACEVNKVNDTGTALARMLSTDLVPQRFAGNIKRAEILSGREPVYLLPPDKFGRAVIASIGSCESCHLYQASRCTVKYEDPDLPALDVLIQYLTQCEGPLWREIRGHGLAYGAGISLKVDTGLLKCVLYRTSDPVLAYKKMKKIIDDTLNGELDAGEFEGAKRSLVFEIVESEGTLRDAATQSLLNYYRGVSNDYNRQLIRRIWDVEIDQLKSVGERYLLPLFDWNTSNTAITCHPSNIDDIISGFKAQGRELKLVSIEDAEFKIV